MLYLDFEFYSLNCALHLLVFVAADVEEFYQQCDPGNLQYSLYYIISSTFLHMLRALVRYYVNYFVGG